MQEQSLPKYLTQDEVRALLGKITSKRDRALFDLIYKYGLRVKEATLIQVKDVDLRRGKIFIRRVKGGVAGEKPLFKDTRRLLRAHLDTRRGDSPLLFVGRQGGLQERRVQQLFKTYLKKAKIKKAVGVHSLRHSIAVHLLDAGQGIEFVQDHLGHADIRNTMIYSKISDPRRRAVFEELEFSGAIVKS